MKEFGFISRASIILQSQFHHCLLCKVIDPQTNLVLSSFLTNTTKKTEVSINRYIEDFYLKFMKEVNTVAVFKFKKEDLQKRNRFDEDQTKTVIHKESDECSVRMEINNEKKVILFNTYKEQIRNNINQDFYWGIAKQTYEKLEKSALNIVEQINYRRENNKKFSDTINEKHDLKPKENFRRTWTLFSEDESKPRVVLTKRSKFYCTPQSKQGKNFSFKKITPKRRKKRPVNLEKKKLESLSNYTGLCNFFQKMEKAENNTLKKSIHKLPLKSDHRIPKNMEMICQNILPKYFIQQKNDLENRGSELISYEPQFINRTSLRSTSKQKPKEGTKRKKTFLRQKKLQKVYKRYASQE